MRNAKIQIALGAVFLCGWLLLGGGYLVYWLCGEIIPAPAELMLLEGAAVCGAAWSVMQILRGICKLKAARPES